MQRKRARACRNMADGHAILTRMGSRLSQTWPRSKNPATSLPPLLFFQRSSLREHNSWKNDLDEPYFLWSCATVRCSRGEGCGCRSRKLLCCRRERGKTCIGRTNFSSLDRSHSTPNNLAYAVAVTSCKIGMWHHTCHPSRSNVLQVHCLVRSRTKDNPGASVCLHPLSSLMFSAEGLDQAAAAVQIFGIWSSGPNWARRLVEQSSCCGRTREPKGRLN